MKSSRPQEAREKAGFSLRQAARKARISESYLQRVERAGDAPYVLAARLARLYNCSIHVFL